LRERKAESPGLCTIPEELGFDWRLAMRASMSNIRGWGMGISLMVLMPFMIVPVPALCEDVEKTVPKPERHARPSGENAEKRIEDKAAQKKSKAHMPGAARPEPTPSVEELHMPDDFSKPIWKWGHLTGDWWGLRPGLDARGMALEFIYTGEVFSNLRGGRARSTHSHDHTEYIGNLDTTVTLDTEKMGLWPGGTFFVYGEQLHGYGISERHVGDVQLVSNLDPERGPFTQVSEYWYEQRLLDDRLGIRVGKQDANAEMCLVDFGVDFINSSFGQIPNVPLPAFPDPALGVTGFADPTDWLSIMCGIYDGEPSGKEWGFESTFDGTGGSFSIIELVLKPELANRLPGKYRVGFWVNSAKVEELFIEPELGEEEEAPVPTARIFPYNYGVYLAFDQAIYKENDDPEDTQGLGAFFQFGWAPQDRNEIWRYYGAGLAYTGLLPGRDEDILGIGFAHARFSARMRRLEEIGESETAIEFFYKAQLTNWMALQPDLQYILTPGGNEDNAVAAGLRFEISF